MMFFSECKTKQEAKELFRKLAKQYHPDKGGSPEIMHNLLKQYEEFEEIKNHSNYNKSNWGNQFKEAYSHWDNEFKESIYEKYRSQHESSINYKELYEAEKFKHNVSRVSLNEYQNHINRLEQSICEKNARISSDEWLIDKLREYKKLLEETQFIQEFHILRRIWWAITGK